ATEPWLFAGMLAAVVLKGALIGAIVGLLWRSTRLAILAGMGLAQIGEFAFVLGHDGVAAGVIAPHVEQAFLAAAILSMAATPFLVRLARRLALIGTGAPAETSPPELRDHVVVIGCGTTGEAVARVLKETGIPFVAVDQLAEHVEKAEREVIPSEFETSIELFVRLLTHLGVPRHVARIQESIIRVQRYQALRGVGASAELLADTRRLIAGGILETAEVMEGSTAAGRTLRELALRDRTGAMVLSVVRRETPLPTPDGRTR